MSEVAIGRVEIAVVSIATLTLFSVFTPWVRVGALEEVDTVNGIDIPVVGWSTVALGVLTIALAVVGLITKSRWLWCAQLVAVGLMVTGATMTLATLDVLDSSIVGWITMALPDEMESTAPDLSATFALWCAYALTVFGVAMGAVAAYLRSSQGRATESDDGIDAVDVESAAAPQAWPDAFPITPPELPPPSWM